MILNYYQWRDDNDIAPNAKIAWLEEERIDLRAFVNSLCCECANFAVNFDGYNIRGGEGFGPLPRREMINGLRVRFSTAALHSGQRGVYIYAIPEEENPDSLTEIRFTYGDFFWNDDRLADPHRAHIRETLTALEEVAYSYLSNNLPADLHRNRLHRFTVARAANGFTHRGTAVVGFRYEQSCERTPSTLFNRVLKCYLRAYQHLVATNHQLHVAVAAAHAQIVGGMPGQDEPQREF